MRQSYAAFDLTGLRAKYVSIYRQITSFSSLKLPFGLPAILVFSILYFSWQLWGLRYTNHDDIFYNLVAHIYAGNYMSFAEGLAMDHARIHYYINFPIALGIQSLAETRLYDVLNIGSILAVYASLIYLLGKIGTTRDAMALIAVALLLFPLHYYYTFPQGYPLMFSWGLCFGLLSAGLLGSYLHQAASWKIVASVILFIFSFKERSAGAGIWLTAV